MNAQTIVILGDADIRAQVKETLRTESNIEIIGELCAMQPRHLVYMSEVEPDIVVLDCASRSINPLLAVAELRKLTSRPRVIAVLPDGGPLDFRAASRLGAEAIVTTPAALRTAVHSPFHPGYEPEHVVAA